ncbi:alpha-glucan family phosphorylase [Candidatus Peregrinibacteria bacterium]|nr:alpha-glucan family phosphorylase [Candidatus Peregrinibacteria bacterium]
MTKQKQIAYFSMEFAFDDRHRNYAGGLGVLAADIMLSMAALKTNSVGISLIYHRSEHPEEIFNPDDHFEKMNQTINLKIENRNVVFSIYKYQVKVNSEQSLPVYYLSSLREENKPWDRDLTKHLYTSNWYTRLCQEYILGVGGVKALEALGYHDIDYYHMNEGHAAPLTLELLRKFDYDEKKVKNHCTFTTHTPVQAGHDYFDYGLVNNTIESVIPWNIKKLATEKSMGMTELALNLSSISNSVSEKHRDVCHKMFPWVNFENVTNGIYHPRWTSPNMKKLFDKYLKNWETKTDNFKNAEKIPDKELVKAKYNDKKALIKWINQNPSFFGIQNLEKDDLFDDKTLTICFARRFVEYKRPDLIFTNLNKLRELGYKKIQLIFSAHCGKDNTFCHNTKSQILHCAKELRGQIKVAVTNDYNLDIAKRLVTGCDLWLNNPIAPMEASGTSGMKVALNGGLNLSIKDGWWIEGIERQPESGWGFGTDHNEHYHPQPNLHDAQELYDELEKVIIEYYEHHDKWVKRMKKAIMLLSFFNTHRVVKQYYEKIWK